MKYFVHDYLIEGTTTNEIEGCFFYHVTIYCTHKKEWVSEDSEKFYLNVGNPEGIAHHLKILQNVALKQGQKSFFSYHIMVLANYDEDEVMRLLKDKVENVFGNNKRELIYNLSCFLEWEYLSDPDAVRKLLQ